MKIPYFLLDVFTKSKLAGNPLAVVLHADGLSEGQMQLIANEFNLSETAFLREGEHEHHISNLRIFTPHQELPFAGHPTIGTAVLLGIRGRVSAVRLEEHIGVVTCVTERAGSRMGYARFALPVLPTPAGTPPADENLAKVLGISVDEIGYDNHRPSAWSAGLPYCLVPVRDSGVLARLDVERRGWEDVFSGGQNAVYIYTAIPEETDVDFAARMFSPSAGLSEDPATGSAAAALIGQIAAQSGIDEGQSQFMLQQGVEMGRPSQIEMQMQIKGGQLAHAAIGGWAVILGEGQLDLHDL